MPIIVDRDQIRRDILMAFQRCIERKPMMNVSLRDIAAEAGMSHAKLLNYLRAETTSSSRMCAIRESICAKSAANGSPGTTARTMTPTSHT